MTFSEFAQMMRRYIPEKNIVEYIRKLTDLIWDEAYTEDIESEKNDENCNPMYNYEDNTLIKIYNGKSNISRNNVNIILTNLNEKQFADYIDNNLNDDSKQDLTYDLEKVGIKVKNKLDIGTKCASLFKSTLLETLKKSNTKKTNTSKQCESSTKHKEIDSLPQFSVPAQFKICFCCKNWDGNKPEFLGSDIRVEGKCMIKYKSKVEFFTCKDSCDNFSPDYGAVAQYNRQNFVKSIDANGTLKFLKFK